MENEILRKYHDIIAREEVFWKQKSRDSWLSAGDRNTRFFHMSALKYKVANKISKIVVEDGVLNKDDEICGEATRFFASLLSVDAHNTLLDAVPTILGEEQNKFLTTIPSKDEIKAAVFSFKGNKAPGPDGFPMFVFQNFWHIVEEDVSNGVKEFFGARSLLKELNSTFIVLVPKIAGADSMDGFHPISLCNSFYKIISKVLTLRLLTILPSIISPQQNGFVQGRQILNSIITVHENTHSLEASHKEGFLMKLDISKAYDRVDWFFLSRILNAFGFSSRVLRLIW